MIFCSVDAKYDSMAPLGYWYSNTYENTRKAEAWKPR